MFGIMSKANRLSFLPNVHALEPRPHTTSRHEQMSRLAYVDRHILSSPIYDRSCSIQRSTPTSLIATVPTERRRPHGVHSWHSWLVDYAPTLGRHSQQMEPCGECCPLPSLPRYGRLEAGPDRLLYIDKGGMRIVKPCYVCLPVMPNCQIVRNKRKQPPKTTSDPKTLTCGYSILES